MRVIAGNYKGRHLKSVAGTSTRPTSDKLKEAIFSIEALSRGMEKAIFVDKSSSAIRTIKQNLADLQLESVCEVYRNDAYRALSILTKRKMNFDLIFLDPPYEKMDYKKLLKKVVEANIMNDRGIIYIEHKPTEEIIFPENVYTIINEKKYSAATAITIIQKME